MGNGQKSIDPIIIGEQQTTSKTSIFGGNMKFSNAPWLHKHARKLLFNLFCSNFKWWVVDVIYTL